jgi:uroporphyrinogen-III synthase
VDDIACYKTVAETEDTRDARLLESGADWITFTSAQPSIFMRGSICRRC